LAGGTDISARGRAGMTPLIWAFLHQNKTGFALLLEHGADPNLQLTDTIDDLATKGSSAMSFAAMHEDIWYLQTVLKHGGDPNLVNAIRSNTPIVSSIFSLRIENAKLLIAAGANLNWQDRNGVTPLISAVIINQYELAYAMLEAGADPTLKTKNGATVLGYTRHPLVPEREQSRQKVLEYLKAKGMDVKHGP
jgi:ankyrin repeat protein